MQAEHWLLSLEERLRSLHFGTSSWQGASVAMAGGLGMGSEDTPQPAPLLLPVPVTMPGGTAEGGADTEVTGGAAEEDAAAVVAESKERDRWFLVEGTARRLSPLA